MARAGSIAWQQCIAGQMLATRQLKETVRYSSEQFHLASCHDRILFLLPLKTEEDDIPKGSATDISRARVRRRSTPAHQPDSR